jgi:4-hydroxy-tetrahydrodipicolinate synthase
MPPLLGRDNPEMVLNYFKAAASETNLGLSVFNTPQAGYMLSPELMAEIAEIENVVALKNHAGVEHTNEIRRLVGDDILVVDPDEPNFLMSVKDHGQQAIFTGTNMMFDSARARPMRDYVEAALAGDFDLATQIRTDMQPIRDMHDKWVMTPWEAQGVCPVSIIKFWTKQLGMTGGVGRSPLVGFSEEGQQGLVADLEAVGLVPEGSLAR